MTTHMNLLIDEEPLQVLPSLACRVGLHEAIVLQQIHYWLNPKRKSGRVVDGTRWIFNSYGQWQEQFPFLTEKVIGNAIRSLEKQGYLLSRQDLNAIGSDRRKWYTIDYDRFGDVERPDSDDGRPYRDDDDAQMGRSSITETTAESTAETTVVPATPKKTTDRKQQPLRPIDPEWWPGDKLRDWCEDEGFTPQQVDAEAAQFKDYHEAKGSQYRDWQAAFRTWMRNSRKWGNNNRATTNGTPMKDRNGYYTAAGLAALANSSNDDEGSLF